MRFLLLVSCILIFRSQTEIRRKVGKSGGGSLVIHGLLRGEGVASIMFEIWGDGGHLPPPLLPKSFGGPVTSKQLSLLEFRIAVERKPES